MVLYRQFYLFLQDGRVLEWVRPEGHLECIADQIVEDSNSLSAGEERNLLALNRSVYELLQQGRWAPVPNLQK